ncbi:MAG TPA: murein biosynthesis integral membrane protein MurJ [Rickettsiales bacterium]|nr:murein biosynthesis integral membrane protein MurJ [Rickettsiales bacterium]
MSLVRASATIGSLTLVSRIFGFVRDMMIASMLGAGIMSDAFIVAFKLPNFMRRLFAEGAFNSAFLPLYAGTVATEGPETARTLVEEIHAVLVSILFVLCVLAVIFMPQVMYVLAPGFDKDPQKYELAVTLTRITFPYILFISLVSLQGGLLNSIDKFAAVAATPIIMNVCFIIAMLIFTPFTPTAAHALAIGVIFSGVTQYWWLQYYCRKAGVAPRMIMPRMTGNVKKLFSLIGPAALGSSVAQINLLIDTQIGTLIPKAPSFLYYADRISELPLGVIGIAVSTALLPMLSRQIRTGDIAHALHTQNRALELAFLFGIPAAVALMVIPEPIIAVIYQRGAFSAQDTIATFHTLIAYACGLPAFLMVKVFASTFYANQDTKTPVKIAIICVFINLFFNLTLMGPMQYVGLALSTSIAGWVNAFALGYQLHKRSLFVADTMFKFRMSRLILAAILMGGALLPAQHLLMAYFTGKLVVKVCALTGLIAVGGGVYGGMLLVLKVLNPAQLREYFKRR